MKTKVRRWGNSLALRIPKPFALEADLDEGESVDLRLEDGKIVVEKSPSVYSLDDLLGGITENNLHEEVDFGDSMGNEVW